METTALKVNSRTTLSTLLVGALLTSSIAGICLAPTEQTMGDAQRVMYMHIAVAWLSLVGFIAMAGFGLGYLLRRELSWDQWSLASCEIGWLCSTLTLATGALWARAAWGTWWTWDPRLVTSFVLWAFYNGNLILRFSLDDPHRRARLCAVMAVIGLADVPLVVMATRWFRGVHPVSPQMEPSMRYALWLSVAGMTAVMILLLVRRKTQLHMEDRVAQIRLQTAEP